MLKLRSNVLGETFFKIYGLKLCEYLVSFEVNGINGMSKGSPEWNFQSAHKIASGSPLPRLSILAFQDGIQRLETKLAS